MPSTTLLNERIQMRMDKLGLRQSHIVRALGVSRPTVSNWLSGGVASLKSSNLLELAKLLKCRPEWLDTGLGSVDPQSTEIQATAIVAKMDDAAVYSRPRNVDELRDPSLDEALQLLKQLSSDDRKEALAWLRGFAAGRKREPIHGTNPGIRATGA